MAIHWRLKTYLATKHGIFRPTEFQKLIVKKTGVLISLQNLCNYLNEKPKTLRLKTIELICSGLECELVDFCEIKPVEMKKNPEAIRKLAYHNTPTSKRAVTDFPDPGEY
jgi:DNA-binding Xre family transcriptional regulator